MSLAGMLAVRRLPSTKVVVRLDPFHWTTELPTKFDPSAVRTNPDPPAETELGLRELSEGSAATVNGSAFDVPPPGAGVKTVTLAVPALAISLARMPAVRRLPSTKVVVRLDPFH